LLTRGLENELSTPKLLQPAFQRGCAHGVVVIRVEDQRLLAAPNDSQAQASPAHQVGSVGWIFPFGDIQGHHFAAPYLDHQVGLQPNTAHGGRQVGDIPDPHLV